MDEIKANFVPRSRPSWLAEPCPVWCAARHRENDLPDDRLHFSSWLRFVALPDAEPVVVGRPPRRQVRQLLVYVEQHVGEDTPRVVLTDEHSADNELRLNVDEAGSIAIALMHGRAIITGDS